MVVKAGVAHESKWNSDLGFQTDPYLSLYQAAVADFNNDGRPDILYRHAVGNSGGNPGVHELLLQRQGGTFTATKFKFTEGDYGDFGTIPGCGSEQ